MTIIKAAVFDAYGTLLDVHSAMARFAERIGPHWPALSQDWRLKQLEYSWIRSLAGPAHHRDFYSLTVEALNVVAGRHGLTDAALIAEIADAYLSLHAYPDVAETLRRLRANGIATAILSNGSPEMLAKGVAAAGISHLLDAVLSVESVGIFKPDRRVYQLAVERFAAEPAQIAFMSSNAWDAFGAREFGFRVFWINRTLQPDEYGLRASVAELRGLEGLKGHGL
jgi:2-haloacid dehalogenase